MQVKTLRPKMSKQRDIFAEHRNLKNRRAKKTPLGWGQSPILGSTSTEILLLGNAIRRISRKRRHVDAFFKKAVDWGVLCRPKGPKNDLKSSKFDYKMVAKRLF